MSGNDKIHLSGTIHAWWQWVLQALVPKQDPDTQHWVLTTPALGLASTNQTRHTELKQGYHQAHSTSALVLAHSFTHRDIISNGGWLLGNMDAQSSTHFLCCRRAMAIYLNLHHSHRGLHGTNLEGVDNHNFDLEVSSTQRSTSVWKNPFQDVWPRLSTQHGQSYLDPNRRKSSIQKPPHTSWLPS